MSVLLAIAEKYWKPLALMLLVAFLLWRAFSFGVESTTNTWNLKWAQRDLQDSTMALHRDVAERAEEQRRQAAVNEEQKRADAELAKAQADFDAAQLAGDGLQRQLANVRRQLAGSETGRISALADASAAKAETARVLAELLSESDKRAGIYAAEADRAYIAGSTCERIYDKVTEQK